MDTWELAGGNVTRRIPVRCKPPYRVEDVVDGVLYVILDTVAGPREVDTTLGKGVREFVGDE